MKKARLIGLIFIVLLGAFALVFSGCGGGGGGGTGGGGGGTGGGGITNSTQASQAAGTGYQSINMAGGSADFTGNIGNLSSLVGGPAPQFKFSKAFKPDPGMAKAIRLSGKLSKSRALMTVSNAIKRAKMMKATYPIGPQTVACTDGGSLTFSGSVTDTGSFDITFTFTNCRENDSQTNGPLHLTGTYSQSGMQMNLTFGSQSTPFTMLEFSYNYAALVSQMTLGLTMNMDMSYSQSGTTLTSHSTMNGQVDVHDYLSQQDYQMTFNNFKEDLSQTTSQTTSSQTITLNGGFTETWTENNVSNSVSLSYSNFKLSEAEDAQYKDQSIDGTVNVDFTPDNCFEGTYVFKTISPFRDDRSLDKTISGHLVINDNTHIEVSYNQATQEQVWVVWYDANGNGIKDQGEVIASGGGEVLYNLAEQCDFYTFDEETPPSSGTGGGTTGNTMTITLSWSGGETSDMDLHLNYYNTTAPTSTTPGAWYVDYHGMNSCPNGYSGVNIDNSSDGSCEVALDFDDTEGYGPEHITASVLPAGYYVVSVNSFDLDSDPQADVSVTIQIGDTLFGPYTHTFTTSDGEGQDPNSWFAVADIVVDTNGNVTVQAHDPALELWHNGAFGLYAPKKAKGLRK